MGVPLHTICYLCACLRPCEPRSRTTWSWPCGSGLSSSRWPAGDTMCSPATNRHAMSSQTARLCWAIWEHTSSGESKVFFSFWIVSFLSRCSHRDYKIRMVKKSHRMGKIDKRSLNFVIIYWILMTSIRRGRGKKKKKKKKMLMTMSLNCTKLCCLFDDRNKSSMSSLNDLNHITLLAY